MDENAIGIALNHARRALSDETMEYDDVLAEAKIYMAALNRKFMEVKRKLPTKGLPSELEED